MAMSKIPWELILGLISLLIKFLLSGMSETDAVREAASIKGVPFSEAMSAWRKYKR